MNQQINKICAKHVDNSWNKIENLSIIHNPIYFHTFITKILRENDHNINNSPTKFNEH